MKLNAHDWRNIQTRSSRTASIAMMNAVRIALETKLTVDQLKAFAEACGYVCLGGRWFRHSGPLPLEPPFLSGELPDFLNNKDALFEALKWFCGKWQLRWEVNQTRNDNVICILTAFDDAGDEDERANEIGETINIAIINAVLAAKEKQ